MGGGKKKGGGFTESFIVPKSVFQRLEEEGGGGDEQVGGKKLRRTFQSDDVGDAEFWKKMAEKRQQITEESASQIQDRAIGPVVTSRGEIVRSVKNEASNDETLSKFFPQLEVQAKVLKILHFIRKHGDLVTWNPKTLEVTIYGKHYPGSNLVDILDFLLVPNPDPTDGIKTYPGAYPDGFYDVGESVPRQADKVYRALKSVPDARFFTDLLDGRAVGVIESRPEVMQFDLEEEGAAKEEQTLVRQEAMKLFRKSIDKGAAAEKVYSMENKLVEAEAKDYKEIAALLKTRLAASKDDLVTKAKTMSLSQLEAEMQKLREERTRVHLRSPTLDAMISFLEGKIAMLEKHLARIRSAEKADLGKFIDDTTDPIHQSPFLVKVLKATYLKRMTNYFNNMFLTGSIDPSILVATIKQEENRKPPLKALLDNLEKVRGATENKMISELKKNYHDSLLTGDEVDTLLLEFNTMKDAFPRYILGLEEVKGLIEAAPPKEKTPPREEEDDDDDEDEEDTFKTPPPAPAPARAPSPAPAAAAAAAATAAAAAATPLPPSPPPSPLPRKKKQPSKKKRAEIPKDKEGQAEADFLREGVYNLEEGLRRSERTRKAPDRFDSKK